MPGLDDVFRTAFGSTAGYLCVALRHPEGPFQEYFFKYPDSVEAAADFSRARIMTHNVYFCPQLLTEKRRVKTNVDRVGCIWADLDECNPRHLLIQPSLVFETSYERYQAIWTLAQSVDSEEAEEASRRVAYYHADQGADRSGWDLTQLLRLPGSRNFKYGAGYDAPVVKVLGWNDNVYPIEAFRDTYPQASGYEYLDVPFPDFVYEEGEKVLERLRHRVNGAAFTLFHRDPEADRSSALFNLEMYCLEAGFTLSEVYQVCRDAACNKFGDNQLRLWKDVCRASAKHNEQVREATALPRHEPSLVTDEEKALAESAPSFIERYTAWAKNVGDAAVQYHEAGAFTLLSSLLAGSVHLRTQYGSIQPNLWFMILADTTLTRKSTAMDLAMDLLNDIDENVLLATDGSVEGFMQALSGRPGRVSLFLRDEFTGFMEQMSHKDYMSGFKEFLTKMYDGRTQKRLLRKEEVTIKDPRLLIFAGGIKSKMQRIVTVEDIESGFFPRFIFITAESFGHKVKPLGPPEETTIEGRSELLDELRQISNAHVRSEPIMFGSKVVGERPAVTEATLTREAWDRYNQVEGDLTKIALDSGEDLKDTLVPMYVRLAVNVLKASILLAAARCLEGPVVVTQMDIIRAATYADMWRKYAQDIVLNVGTGPMEHKIQLVYNAISKRGNEGFPRSRIMQTYHLTAREMDDIEKTLIHRGLIHRGGGGSGAVTYRDLKAERR